MNARGLAALLALSLPAPCRSMDVERLVVAENGGAYSIEFEAVLDASIGGVIAVLTDYPRYPSLDQRIVEAQVMADADGRPLLFTRLRGCLISWLCRDLDRYERVSHDESSLIAAAVPGMGDLERGLATTYFEARGQGTHVRYRNDFKPSFWMPRFLVRATMLRTLESATRTLFANAEARAQRGDHP